MLRNAGIRVRIAALQATLVLAVLAMASGAALLVAVTGWHDRRVGLARDRLEAAVLLQAGANRYSEQIAEILLLGDEEVPDFVEARAELLRGFAELDRLTLPPPRPPAGGDAPAPLARARTLLTDVDRAVERVLALRSEGRQREATALFRDEIETRLDADLDGALRTFAEGERAEVRAAEALAVRRRSQLAWGTAAVSLLALLVTMMAGRRLRRSLVRPIAALAEAADALGAGALDRRVAPGLGVGGELGVLAARLDSMAAQLGEQRDGLLRSRDLLEAEVRRRTAELQAANLRLREVDGARVRLLADLSHELRTPLTVLRGEAELALRGGVPPGAAERALEMVLRQATQMERLVGDLLFLARSEAELAAFATRRVALQDVAAEAVEEAAVLARRDPQDLLDVAGWPEEPIPVEADPQRLKQAILIGVENALKYAAGADARVRVGVAVAGPGEAEVTVANGGPGLAPEELGRAFDRFFRGRNASAAGSGLGLSIAKWIVERHGGTIKLRSAPGGPTEFRLRLPIAAEEMPGGEDPAGGGRPPRRELRPTRA